MKKYYIAYGSNMDVEQMKWRCPNAQVAGLGYAVNWKLEFHLHADIVPSQGSKVPVVIWEIDEQDELNLDRYESVPNYYVRKWIDVTTVDGLRVNGLVYIMVNKREIAPQKQYVAGILNGYKRFGFKAEIDNLMQAVKDGKERAENGKGYL